MNINFPLILVLAVIITGLIWLADVLFFTKKRKKEKPPLLIEYARSFFSILLIVLLIRSFLIEPFRIPTGSLEPTLLPGDFILVNKYDYGLRLPVLDTKFLAIGEPKLGDIVVFHWPPNPKIDFIKRAIGFPGDHISYINKVIFINGKPMQQKVVGEYTQQDEYGNTWRVIKATENLNGVIHYIYTRPDLAPFNFYDIVVPKDAYFMMGDNRDDSQDSRYWGFVPEKNLVGKAIAIWFSWDGVTDRVRWRRMGSLIH